MLVYLDDIVMQSKNGEACAEALKAVVHAQAGVSIAACGQPNPPPLTVNLVELSTELSGQVNRQRSSIGTVRYLEAVGSSLHNFV